MTQRRSELDDGGAHRAFAHGAAASRRDLLALGGAVATLGAVRSLFPTGVHAQGAGPEVKGTKLGYIALTDAAPLIIAKEKGIYAKHGLPDMVFPVSIHETNFGSSRREEFWFIVAARSEDETEFRAGKSTGRASAEGHPASDAPSVFG